MHSEAGQHGEVVSVGGKRFDMPFELDFCFFHFALADQCVDEVTQHNGLVGVVWLMGVVKPFQCFAQSQLRLVELSTIDEVLAQTKSPLDGLGMSRRQMFLKGLQGFSK